MSGLARALRRELVPDPFTAGPLQWGKVGAAHSGSTTLAAAASAGATSVSTNATVPVNSYVLVGSATVGILTTGVSGSGPFTVSLAGPLAAAAASGAAVSVLNTVDVYLDGSSNLTVGLRYLAGYSPAVGDVVVVLRCGADRLALGRPA